VGWFKMGARWDTRKVKLTLELYASAEDAGRDWNEECHLSMMLQEVGGDWSSG
jgi:hypothetical protein